MIKPSLIFLILLTLFLIGCGTPPQEKAIAELKVMTEILQNLRSENKKKKKKEVLMESAKRFKESSKEWRKVKREMNETEADEIEGKLDEAYDVMRDAMREAGEYGVKRFDFDLR